MFIDAAVVKETSQCNFSTWVILTIFGDMGDLLDYIVSETWLMTTVFIVVCFIPTIVIIYRPFKNLILARITQITVAGGAFAFLMYLAIGPDGYALQYIGGLTNGKEICLIEMHYQGDGDAGHYEVYRLYVLDLNTGERLSRTSVESQELLCVTDMAVFFERTGAVAYDLKSGEKVKEWSKEKGFENFPELQSGISELNRQSASYQFKNEAWLTLTAKNGHQYCYNLLTDELLEIQYPPNNSEGPIVFDEYEVSRQSTHQSKEWYFNFKEKTGEIKQLVYHTKNNTEKILEGEYLNPKMVAVYPDQKLFIIQHFTTVENTSAIYTAVTFDQQIKWRITQSELQTSDKFSDQPLPGISFPINDQLIATFGGLVVLLNAADGSAVWKSVQ